MNRKDAKNKSKEVTYHSCFDHFEVNLNINKEQIAVCIIYKIKEKQKKKKKKKRRSQVHELISGIYPCLL